MDATIREIEEVETAVENYIYMILNVRLAGADPLRPVLDEGSVNTRDTQHDGSSG